MALWPALYGDADGCYSTGYYDYDYGPTPDLTYAHESGELIEYDKSYAYYTDDSFATSSELNYSVYTYSEPKMLQYDQYHSYNYHDSSVYPSETHYIQPKFLQYEPSPSDRGYFPCETKFTISYSSVEFNEPEFEEYDPTPYGGGYDPVTTYGKPLPPSEATCYPPTLPRSDNTSLENFSYSSIPSPYGKDDLPTSKPPNADKVSGDGKENLSVSHIPSPCGKDDDLPTKPPNGDGVMNDEHEIGFEIESEKQYSYGSGLEAIDLCESLFGYWPCLAKQARNKCQACDQEIRADPWDQCAADYLFGSPILYDYQH